MTKETQPLISVVIPTFNRADLIQETVQSVLAQTYTNIEVLVVDDGSSDNTEEVIAAMQNDRLHFIRNPHTGLPSATRNAGIAQARGEYIAFIDSDDLWLPEKLQRQYDFLQANPEYGWCYCGYHLLDHDTLALREVSLPQDIRSTDEMTSALMINNFIASPTPLIRQDLLRVSGGFDERQELRFVEDWELWLRLAAISPAGFLPESLARYRLHSTDATRAVDHAVECARRGAAIRSGLHHYPDRYKEVCAAAIKAHCLPHAIQLLRLGKFDELRLVTSQLRSTPAPYAFHALSILAQLPTPLLMTLREMVKTTKAFFRFLLSKRDK